MKKTYFEPETKVTEMNLNAVILQGTGDKTNLDPDGEMGDNDLSNKRDGGKEATWGNLW